MRGGQVADRFTDRFRIAITSRAFLPQDMVRSRHATQRARGAVLGVCSLFASATCAEQAPVLLDTVVVTAEAAPFFSAAAVDEAELEARPPRNVPEAIRLIPGVSLQRTAPAQASPFIRGFTSYRTLGFVDGIRVDSALFRAGASQYFSTVDPLSLSRVEVVKGGGAVLFGSDAVGGVISMATKSPLYRADGAAGVFASSAMFGRWSSAEASYTGRAEASLSKNGRFGLHVGVTGRQFGDLRVAGLGRLPYTGYDECDFDAKLELFPARGQRIIFVHQQVHQDDAWRIHSTLHARSWEGTLIGDELRRSLDQDRLLTYARWEGIADGWLNGFRFTLSHQRQGESQERIRANRLQDYSGFLLDTCAADLRLESRSPIGTLIYGATASWGFADTWRANYDAEGHYTGHDIQGPTGDGARTRQVDVYLQDEFSPAERLRVLAGVRYSRHSVDIARVEDPVTGAPFGIEDHWHSVVGNLRGELALDGAQHTHLFAGISQAFRAPNLSDLSRFDDARSDELQVPSPNLDPERYVLCEIGLRNESERVSWRLAGHFTDIRDYLLRTPTGRVIDGDREVLQTNAGRGYVYGFDAEALWRFAEGWSAFAGGSWLDGRIEDYPTSERRLTREPLPKLPPPRGHLGLRWEGARFHFETIAEAVARADRLNSADLADTQRIPPAGTPGWFALHLHAGCKISSHCTVNAAIENVLNADYRLHGSGINEPGRNFVVSAEVRF